MSIKPVGYYSSSMLAQSLAEQYESKGTLPPLDRTLALIHAITEEVQDGNFTEADTLVYLASVVAEYDRRRRMENR